MRELGHSNLRERPRCNRRFAAGLFVFIVFFVLIRFPSTGFGQTAYFSTTPTWSSGSANYTKSVALGDVDGDGDLDLVCGNRGQGNTLYRNDGTAFDRTPVWSSGPPPKDTETVALGDIDGDGDLDLVCGNYGQKNTLYLNHGGTLGLTPVWSSDPANRTFSVVLGDIDGDGDLDLVCGNYDQNSTIYLNDGGTLDLTPFWSSERAATWSVALGDIDGDGDLDLVCGNFGQRNTLYLNDGETLGVTPVWLSNPANYTTSVALGDVDGDGDLDLICGNRNQRNTLYRNNGGKFDPAPVWSCDPQNSTQSVALGDVDGDGDLDLVCGNRGQTAPGDPGQQNTLYVNDGGTLGPTPVWWSESENFTHGVALGDIDGDGDLDLVCGNNIQSNTAYRNDGGTFSPGPVWSSGVTGFTTSIALGDVEGDGDLDLVCGNKEQPNTLYRNEGGAFSLTPVWSSGPANLTLSVALGDVNGDGDLDLVCGNGDQVNTLYWCEGDTFGLAPGWSSRAANWTPSVALGDVVGNGYLDLVCGNTVRNTLYRNDGGALGLRAYWVSGPTNTTESVTLGDVDGDGDLDLVCGNRGRNTLYLNDGGVFGSEPVWSSGPTSATLGVGLGDVDGDGDLDLVCGNSNQSNTLYLNEGGVFGSEPVWSSGPRNLTSSIALGDVDGDGDLDLVCGNGAVALGQSNTLYLNDGGAFDRTPAWSSGPTSVTMSVALGDVDEDGDLDLVCGNRQDGNKLYASVGRPLYKFDPASPTYHLPNNSAYVRWVRVDGVGDNIRRVRLAVIDIESDPVWIVPEYQYEGAPTWLPVEVVEGGDRVGPLHTSPGGVEHTFDWDISRVAFDRRPVVLRLRTISVPKRVSIVQHVDSYLKPVGSLEPVRPAISVATAEIEFDVVTVGDTVIHHLDIRNDGNAALRVLSTELPSVEMRTTLAQPVIEPGETSTMTVFVEPHAETDISGDLVVRSNDPVRDAIRIAVRTNIRPLLFATKLRSQQDRIPIGEAVTIEVDPAEDVVVERGTLYHRPGGESSFESIELTKSFGEFIAIIPGDKVTEAGIDYYAEVENSGVFNRDPPDTVYFQPAGLPTSITTNPVPTGPAGDFLEERNIVVGVALQQGTVFDSGQLHCRRGGTSDFSSTDLDEELRGVIPDSLVGSRGVEYYVSVTTPNLTLYDPPAGVNAPRSIPIVVGNLVEPRSHAGLQYRLLSIPLAMRGTIAGTLTDELGGPDISHWRMFAYDPQAAPGANPYIELPNEAKGLTAFEQGRGYWLITKDRHRIGSGPDKGETAPTERLFEITLEPGYNLIGNPFAFPVDWNTFMVDTFSVGDADTIIESPVARVGGEWVYDTTVLEPFEGYWVKNITTNRRPVTLKIPAIEAISSAPTMTAGASATARWRLQIDALSGTLRDDAWVGIEPGANEEWDPLDRSQPPAPPDQALTVYFPHGDWHRPGRYAIDIRLDEPGARREERGHIWRFDIAKNFTDDSGGDEVGLTINGIDGVPEDLEIRLVDDVLGRTTDVRAENRYAFFQGKRSHIDNEDESRFSLMVGTSEFIRANEDRLPRLPTTTALHQNYPNPFNPSTVIRYDVAGGGRVTLRVYDVSGKLVKLLEDRTAEPGRYEVGWDGENTNGEPVASGVYFYRLRTEGKSLTRKMILLK